MQPVMLFISPHLDDAVLSCGGLIAAIVRRGGQAFVVTVFAGDEPAVPAMPPVARELHRAWGAGLVGPRRRMEDHRALSILGAGFEHLSFQDAIYRRDDQGAPRCEVREDIFSNPTDADRSLTRLIAVELERIIERLRPWSIHAPAGIGGHLDHLVTRAAVVLAGQPRAIRGHLWYEEMPYSTSARGAPMLKALAGTAVPILAKLTDREWELKLAAIRAYESQVPTLWRSGDWPTILRGHAYEVGGGELVERLWLPVVGSEPFTGARPQPEPR